MQLNADQSSKKICTPLQTGVKVHSSAWQWPKAYSYDNTDISLGQVSEYHSVAKAQTWTSWLNNSGETWRQQFTDVPNLIALERLFQEEWQKRLKNGSAYRDFPKMTRSYNCFTVWNKGYLNMRFKVLINKLHLLKTVVIRGYCVYIHGQKKKEWIHSIWNKICGIIKCAKTEWVLNGKRSRDKLRIHCGPDHDKTLTEDGWMNKFNQASH